MKEGKTVGATKVASVAGRGECKDRLVVIKEVLRMDAKVWKGKARHNKAKQRGDGRVSQSIRSRPMAGQ